MYDKMQLPFGCFIQKALLQQAPNWWLFVCVDFMAGTDTAGKYCCYEDFIIAANYLILF